MHCHNNDKYNHPLAVLEQWHCHLHIYMNMLKTLESLWGNAVALEQVVLLQDCLFCQTDVLDEAIRACFMRKSIDVAETV